MLYLVLAVVCSVSIGMIFKYAGREGMDRVALLTANYAAAVGVAVIILAAGVRDVSGGLVLSPSLIALGVGTGALLIFGFFVLSLATDVAGMSLAIGVMRVSVVIPFLASWFIWSEEPSLFQIVGLVLASIAFFLIARTHRDEPRNEATPVPVATEGPVEGGPAATSPAPQPDEPTDYSAERVFGVLALVFLSGGAVDVTMKTFEETFGAISSRVLFLLLAFGIAFLIGLAIVLWRGLREGAWPEPRTVAWGVGLGVINYGSLEFILRAIEALPGTFVFPVNNIAIVILAALVGVLVWKEHLTRYNQWGLALAVVALVLLNV